MVGKEAEPATYQKVGPASRLGSTAELTLLTGVQMNRPKNMRWEFWLRPSAWAEYRHPSACGEWESWLWGQKSRRAILAPYQLQHLREWPLHLPGTTQ